MKSLCRDYGCGRLVEGHGRCPEHQVAYERRRRREGRTGQRGSTGRWRRLRNAVLARDRRRCQAKNCVLEISERNPLEVHHVDGDPHNDRLDNLVTLCRLHHDEADHEIALERRKELRQAWP